jgi:hypothetical protein
MSVDVSKERAASVFGKQQAQDNAILLLFYANFFLILHPEDRGDVYFRNVDSFSYDCTQSYPRRQNVSDYNLYKVKYV